MPWDLNRKPFLILELYSFVGYKHQVVHKIKHISKKYAKIVLENLYDKLIIGTETIKIDCDQHFVALSTRLYVEYNTVIIQVSLSFLRRYITLHKETPLHVNYRLQIIGDDPDGLLTKTVL